MRTEQLWFRMFANLPEQSDVVDLRMKLGWEGYGIFVGILCLLRGSMDGTLPTDYNKVGWQLHCSNDKVKSIITSFGLFELTEDGKRFFNQELMDEMKQYQSMLDERRVAGRNGAERRWRAKCDRNSNGETISETQQAAENAENDSKPIANATVSDSLKQYNKETLNTSYYITQSDKSETPKGVGGEKKKIISDFFSSLDDSWREVALEWYGYKKEMSPRMKIATFSKQYDLLVQMSKGDVKYAKEIVSYSIGQGYTGLYEPSQGRGQGGAKSSRKNPKDVEYSNKIWENKKFVPPTCKLPFEEDDTANSGSCEL